MLMVPQSWEGVWGKGQAINLDNTGNKIIQQNHSFNQVWFSSIQVIKST